MLEKGFIMYEDVEIKKALKDIKSDALIDKIYEEKVNKSMMRKTK